RFAVRFARSGDIIHFEMEISDVDEIISHTLFIAFFFINRCGFINLLQRFWIVSKVMINQSDIAVSICESLLFSERVFYAKRIIEEDKRAIIFSNFIVYDTYIV